ncbi:hypothetical protein D210916BOD24_03120 [Alteromonas sp. D210916BOD_24]|uniref:phosphatase PAP2 family protein n=1 Tax=Alteromonas sp. D210916BOD_24 TaxID=3157618 RepID=UPI00399D2EF0
MRENDKVEAYTAGIKTPAIQVLLLGSGFLLIMLFAYMGVLVLFDNVLYSVISGWGDVVGWQRDVLRDITALGSNTVLGFVTLSVAIALSLAGEKTKATTFVFAVVTGLAVAFLLKAGISRDRPPVLSHDVQVYTQSFPSAHATMSALVYFYVAYLVCGFTRHKPVRYWIYFTVTLLVFSIGMSRVLLGVHWPSDVIAGWFAGGSMVAFAFYIIKWKRKLSIDS